MVRVWTPGVMLTLTLLTSAACSHEPQAAAAASRQNATAAGGIASVSDVPHGDHNPHHGGVVFMHGELHFEVVLDRAGRHRVYFSDAARADLPASVASGVTLEVTRANGIRESIAGRIDESGESWAADGQPVETSDATARISLSTSDGPYWIDMPFVAVEP